MVLPVFGLFSHTFLAIACYLLYSVRHNNLRTYILHSGRTSVQANCIRVKYQHTLSQNVVECVPKTAASTYVLFVHAYIF